VLGAYPVDRRVRPDGTLEPFAVPAGQVLVLTSASWTFAAGGSSLMVVLSLVAEGGVRRKAVYEVGQAVAGGHSTGRALLGDLVVRPGDTLCVGTTIATGDAEAAVHGFLTADE
jgi:hypothetical protein